MSTELAVQQPGGAVAHQPTNMLQAVMQAALNPELEPARLREFLEMGRQLEADNARREFISDMLALKTALPVINRNGRIQYFDKLGQPKGKPIRYAKYEDIARELRPLLEAHGFATSFDAERQDTKLVVKLTVMHRGGHKETFYSIPVPLIDSSGGKTDIQGAGSAMAYAKRYVLCSAFDIVTEGDDTDGNPPAATLTEEQAATLRQMLSGHDKIAQRLLVAYQVERLEDIPAAMYNGAVALVEKAVRG